MNETEEHLQDILKCLTDINEGFLLRVINEKHNTNYKRLVELNSRLDKKMGKKSMVVYLDNEPILSFINPEITTFSSDKKNIIVVVQHVDMGVQPVYKLDA